MGEFSETLSRMKREGNALSATLCGAWDGKTLRIRTRKEPLIATDAHISVIGHITVADLESLGETVERIALLAAISGLRISRRQLG
jgi:hypothetical protein